MSDLGSFQWPPTGTPIQVYSTLSAFPSGTSFGQLAIAQDTGNLYEWNNSAWVLLASENSALSLGNLDAQAATAKGAAIVGGALSLQSADATHPGLVNNTTQTLSGNKTFSGTIQSPSLLLPGSVSGLLTLSVPSNLSSYSLTLPGIQGGVDTYLKNDGSGGLSWASGSGGGGGVTSVGTIDSQTKNSDGLTIGGTTLYAQTANATNPGMVSTGTQTLAGAKTFSTAPILSSLTASLPLQLDASKNIVSTAIDLSGAQATGALAAGRFPALTGDITTSAGALATTLATVNVNVGSFGTASGVSAITVNGKGLVTAAVTTAIQIAESQVTNLVTDLAGKQATGNYVTALTGDGTASGPGSAALTLATVNSNVGSFGSSTSIPSITVNGKGLVTAASGNVVVAPAGTLSGTTLNSTVVTSSLTSVGTIATGTWNGTAITIANGGTGQTAKAAAFDALQPMTTGGDIIYGGASGTGTRLANGTAGQVLQSNGGTAAPSWASPALPTGSIIDFAAATAPSGYLICDGTAVSRSTYATLFAVIGNTWGNGDGSTTFTLPDLRGKFTRGQDLGASNDPDQNSRTAQTSSTFTVGGGSTTVSNSTITVTSTAELAPGMTVIGTNIPANSVVRVVLSSTTFTLGNQANTSNTNATGTTGSLTFTFSKSATANYVGSTQVNQLSAHSHSILGGTGGSTLPINNASTSSFCGLSSGSLSYFSTAPNGGNLFIADAGGSENRPINAYVLKCIKT